MNGFEVGAEFVFRSGGMILTVVQDEGGKYGLRSEQILLGRDIG